MAPDENVAAGLLNWINSLNVTDPVHAVEDLASGEVLWKVLRAAHLLSIIDRWLI